MSSLYDDFEKRFKNAWFSAGWIDAETVLQKKQNNHKSLEILQSELQELENNMENILQKKLHLENLAKLYHQN
jgi:hypothetical protein